MEKSDLIQKVSKETEVDLEVVKLVINSFLENIKNSLLYGVNVNIKEFASFVLNIKNKRKLYNVATGKTREVPKTYWVKVTMAHSFRNLIRQKTVY